MKVSLYAKHMVLLTVVATVFLACGYQPSSKYARQIVGEKISTSVVISALDPENTVIIKDAVDSAVISVFHSALTSRQNSQTHLNLSITNPSYTPVQYDANGFVIGYRMSIALNITRQHNGLSKGYITHGTYDFAVDPNAVVTEQQRFDAIKLGAAKAIRSFIAQVSAEGARAQEKEKE